MGVGVSVGVGVYNSLGSVVLAVLAVWDQWLS